MLLHHIGIAVKDIHKANKEYLLRPGFRQASNIIHDKIQTAKVMFLQVARDRVLWELVMPDSADSILKGAINKGGGLNHLCYEVSDIEAYCEKLRDSGLLLLHSPIEASAFPNRRIAWLMGKDGIPIELIESENKNTSKAFS